MKLVFFGTSEFAVPILKSLRENFEVSEVVTTLDKPAGRKKQLTPSPVKKIAQKLKIPVYQPENLTDQSTIKHIKEKQPDLIVLASFGQIIPKSVLEIPRLESLNIHPSLLPKYRGPSPIQATILSGDTKTGVTITTMEEKVDAGKILVQIEIPVEKSDNTSTLTNKLSLSISTVLPKVLEKWVKGKVSLVTQEENKATYTKKLSKESGYIDWANPPANLERMIRAYYPWPGVWTRYHGKILKLLPDKKIQVEGKAPIRLEAFQRGYPDFKLLW